MFNAQYSIEIQSQTKEVTIAVSGSFQEKDAQSFVNSYQSKVGSINAEEFDLIVDSKSLVVVSPKILPLLEECYKMYKASGFKSIKFIAGSATVGMQLRRIASKTELSNVEVEVISK
ncbi:hypothetical protein M3N64_02430 [Sporolactobacillus sp. CPB3-1]|uniref:STAS domain-containing protein n=1 Tax=Sporolactobacillus mangiferae TaxID=2940498 RepID=A0ABT0M957_9BACL|nr:hypothetical protein [Sporolactobacillus mangiferae]MCL1630799.1 hypothetical protein [Sporolactobacillus mangiferae]